MLPIVDDYYFRAFSKLKDRNLELHLKSNSKFYFVNN